MRCVLPSTWLSVFLFFSFLIFFAGHGGVFFFVQEDFRELLLFDK